MMKPDGGYRDSTQEHKPKVKYYRKEKYKNYEDDLEDIV